MTATKEENGKNGKRVNFLFVSSSSSYLPRFLYYVAPEFDYKSPTYWIGIAFMVAATAILVAVGYLIKVFHLKNIRKQL